MPDPVAEQLHQDMACEGLLECLHGLTQLDTACYRTIIEADEALTIDEVAAAVDRERSTAYRSIQRLLQTGFVQQEQVNYDQGGYYHVYYPTDPSAVAEDMQRLVDDWHEEISRLIRAFEEKYGGARDEPAGARG